MRWIETVFWLASLLTLSAFPDAFHADAADPVLTQRSRKSKSQSQSEQETLGAAQQRAIAAFEDGQRAHGEGELQDAIEKYSEALEIVPKFPEALYQRGMAHLALKQLDQARADLSTLAELEAEVLALADGAKDSRPQSFFARAHSTLGDIFAQRGDQAQAEENYRRAIELDPNDPRAATSLATLLIQQKAYQQAATLLRSAAGQGGASAQVYSLLGYAYEESKQPDLALEAYDKAIDMEPRDTMARLRRSHLRAARQDYPGAIEDMTVVYEQDGSGVNALELGALYERAGTPAAAIGVYERALKNSHPSTETKSLRLKLIDLLLSVDRRDDALAQAQQFVEANPNDTDALARLGNLLLPTDSARAAQVYLRAVKLDPDNVDYRVALSASLLKTKQYQDALSISLDAVQRAPENYYVHSNLAAAYFQLQQFAQAAEQFKWIIGHRPETAVAYYFLGICYDKMMEYELALPAYERFLEIADAGEHQMEIDNVRFRLPGVRRMIEKGRGQRKKR